MDSKIKMPWLEVGYTIFSNEGPKALKIEALARKVGKNKSSFYHCFAITGFNGFEISTM
jgi:AcrR family transcriptional regulator